MSVWKRLVWSSIGFVLAVPAWAGSMDSEPKKTGGSPLEPAVDRVLKRLHVAPSMLSLKAALEQMERTYPGRLRLESYGTSRQGRALQRLRILPWDAQLARVQTGQPAVLVVPQLSGDADPLPMLIAAARQAAAKDSKPSLEWVLYPMPDPDGWVGGVPMGKRVRLDRNFPGGWLPWSEGLQHPGSAPLSEPETRNLATSMALCKEAVALLVLGADSQPGPKGFAPGSLERHGRDALDLSVLALADADALGAALKRVDDWRPKLRVRTVLKKRLSQDLHLVELELGHGGHGDLSHVDLGVNGATSVKLAWAKGAGEPHVLLDSMELPPLAAGSDSMRVRLVLRVTDPKALVVHLNSPRVQGVALELPEGNSGEPSHRIVGAGK